MWLNLNMFISHTMASTTGSTILNHTMAIAMLDQATAMLSRITLDLSLISYITSRSLHLIMAIATQVPCIILGLAAIHTMALTEEVTPLDTKHHTGRQHPTEHLITEHHTEDQVVQYLSEEAQHHSEVAQYHLEEEATDLTEVDHQVLTEADHQVPTEVDHQVISEEAQVPTEEDQAHPSAEEDQAHRSAEDQEVPQVMEGDPLADQEDATEHSKQPRRQATAIEPKSNQKVVKRRCPHTLDDADEQIVS